MEKVSVLGIAFPVEHLEIPCVSVAFVSKQTWSDTRIYTVVVSESNIGNRSYDDLLNDTVAVCAGTAMRNGNRHHIAIVDADLRVPILKKMNRTLEDFAALIDVDEAFTKEYDGYISRLYLGKTLGVEKVILSVATLTDGEHTTYISRIGDSETKATAREIYCFAATLQKEVNAAAAAILSSFEDEDDQTKEEE